MKINSVKGYEIGKTATKSTTSFKAGFKPDDIVDYGKEIAKHSKPFANLLSKLKDGEVMNILTTAFGTAVVAPIFIAFNPISKKDKETKMYSALRQPISAVIAVAAQLGVVKTFNNYLDKAASTGVVEKMNLADQPQASYLKKLILMENPNISKKDLAAEIKRRQGEAMAEAIKRNTDVLAGKSTDEILTTELLSVKDVTKKKEELIKAFKEKIKAGTATMSLKEYKKTLTPDFVMAEKLKDIKAGIESVATKSAEKISFEIGKKATQDAFSVKLLEAITGTKSGEKLAEIFKKVSKARNVLSNNKTFMQEIERMAKESGDTELIKIVEKMVKEANEVGGEAAKKAFSEVLENSKKSETIAQYTKQTIAKAGDMLGSMKKYGGIVLSLLTLPLTCGILNWSYPRIVEKFFPNLAKAKSSKGSTPPPSVATEAKKVEV